MKKIKFQSLWLTSSIPPCNPFARKLSSIKIPFSTFLKNSQKYFNQIGKIRLHSRKTKKKKYLDIFEGVSDPRTTKSLQIKKIRNKDFLKQNEKLNNAKKLNDVMKKVNDLREKISRSKKNFSKEELFDHMEKIKYYMDSFN